MSAELDLEPTKSLNTDEVRARLRRKFPANEYAMLYEVRDAAGFGANRSADVVMVGLWPSRGCLIEGMELKVSRGDWLRELKKPEKAEAFVPYCDRWWIVAGNASVVKLDELPPTWGLMVPGGQGLKVVREAPKLDPKPVDRSLLAAMLKRACGATMDDPEIRALIDAQVKSAVNAQRAGESYELTRAKDDLKRLQKQVQDFETASGVHIGPWNGERIGDAVALVLKGEHKQVRGELERMKGRVAELHQRMQEIFPESEGEK